MHALLMLAAAVAVCVPVHQAGFVLSALGWRIPIQEFVVGTGPVLFRRVWRKTEFVLRLVPLGGYVKFKGSDVEDDEPPPGGFDSAPALVRVLILLGGPLATFLIACVLLGPAEAARSLGNGMVQCVRAVTSKAYAADLVSTTRAWLSTAPFLTILGVVASKVAAFNLLPVPTLNGGDALMALFRGRGEAPAWWKKAQYAGLLVVLGALVTLSFSLLNLTIKKP